MCNLKYDTSKCICTPPPCNPDRLGQGHLMSDHSTFPNTWLIVKITSDLTEGVSKAQLSFFIVSWNLKFRSPQSSLPHVYTSEFPPQNYQLKICKSPGKCKSKPWRLITSHLLEWLLAKRQETCAIRMWRKRKLVYCWGECKLVQSLWKTEWRFG